MHERERDRGGGVESAVLELRLVEGRGQRLTLRVADAEGDTGAGVRLEGVATPVRVGPARTVGGDGADHERRVAAGQRLRRQAQPRGLFGPERVQQHVGIAEQRLQPRPPLGRRDVQAAAALGAVEEDEEAAALRVRLVAGKRSVGAERIASRRFDLDHLGAEVAEELAGVGQRLALADLDDAQPVEGPAHDSPWSRSIIASASSAMS